MRIVDEGAVWQALLAYINSDPKTGTKGLLSIEEFNKDFTRFEQCKADHTVLFDYMYDEVPPDTAPERRPAHDKYKADPEKALVQLKTIKKNYPGIATLPIRDKAGKEVVTPGAIQAVNNWVDAVKGKFPDIEEFRIDPKNPATIKAPLTLVEEEIDFRRKIDATRRLLCKQAQDLITYFQNSKQDEPAAKYREMAIRQIDILLKSGESDSPSMMLLSAEMKFTNQKYEEALDDLYRIRDILKRDGKDQTDDYFVCMRKISETYAKQNKWKNAGEYPVFIAVTTGVNDGIAKRLWPEMGVFLEECYKNGVTRPKEVPKEVKKDDEKKDEKKEDAKKEEPKDEKKEAPADKKDEAKGDKKEDKKEEAK
jgi:hypothetical protein